jgi:hypothetical protein
MEGYLTLVNVKFVRSGWTSLPSASSTSSSLPVYSGVQGLFCHLSWAEQERDPAHVPMLADLKATSPLCSGTLFTADLYTVARQAYDYDSRNHTFAATEPRPGQGPVPPTAVIFHQSRCGSTLVSNLLAAAMPPGHTRVYSEAPAALTALQACASHVTTQPCLEDSHVQLVRDVFYLMGRATRPLLPQYVYYKLSSIGAHNIEIFQKAYPQTPWAFVYRDPTEILMSHLKHYYNRVAEGNPLSEQYMPICLRHYGEASYIPSPYMMQVVTAQGRTLESLSPEEYCAAHVASLGEAAVAAYERTAEQAGSLFTWFFPYTMLPHMLWETMVPALQGPVSEAQRVRMQHVARYYSKGRGPRAGEVWKEDAIAKRGSAPDSLHRAVRTFMEPTYQKLQVIYEALKTQSYH